MIYYIYIIYIDIYRGPIRLEGRGPRGFSGRGCQPAVRTGTRHKLQAGGRAGGLDESLCGVSGPGRVYQPAPWYLIQKRCRKPLVSLDKSSTNGGCSTSMSYTRG